MRTAEEREVMPPMKALGQILDDDEDDEEEDLTGAP